MTATVIIITLIIIPIMSLLYRLGGMSKSTGYTVFPWIPPYLVSSFTRDYGISFITIIWVYLFMPHVAGYLYFISLGLMLAAISTYHDWSGRDNFGLHGLGIGLSLLPIAYGNGMWVEVVARSIILAFLMDIWCKSFTNASMEEYGRGAFIGLTLFITTEGFLSWLLSLLS